MVKERKRETNGRGGALDPEAFRGRSVLVTGAAGFIGSHLVDALVSRGAQVRALDNFATGRRENLEHVRHAIELLEGDLRDAETCRRACDGVFWIFHQAALGSVPRSVADPGMTIAVNVSGTVNIFAAARDARVGRVVYASSSSVYGDSAVLPKREGQEGKPLSPYALSKRMNEEAAEVFGRCFHMELIGLRYFNVYGPRQDPDGPYAAVIPRFFRACLRDESPVIYGDGAQTRDFTFVEDAVEANLLAATAPIESCGRAYNIATGRQTNLLELAGMIRQATGGSRPPAHQAPRPGDVPHSVADVTLVAKMLGYRPSVPLEAGLRASRSYYEHLNEAPQAPGRTPAASSLFAKREEP
jgi:nucleoside-diphosphate-sugar epimerase